ncbi:MAG: AmmeMemoRadiSam system protein B [candidate division KSB1 bacterium]|nr:AmmeMemoRadiSam system protein B [candidate division KSB1 bacterium]MDZ7303107.1 AmmeMemoRadiSam system protein B [candidate division KSB1 bacterium]MDZ7312646.1 AmmeMemoRadiSam system protein B [candidate division KSB1 bacterium]
MKNKKFGLILILSLLFVVTDCRAQNAPTDRKPAVAGQFYPAQKDELRRTLQNLFARANPSRNIKNVVAIISPHAGYVYSGEVAASSFNQIDPAKAYDNIFVLGPSHRVDFQGAAVYSQGNYVTPLGPVIVNRDLAEQLVKNFKVFCNRVDAHLYEHSVEVQLPFLQYIMQKEFRIVPIVVGSGTAETYIQIAEALRPHLNPRNLFIISTDFSHYPAYDDARIVDKATAEAILSNSPANLIKTLKNNDAKGIPNLATSMCGWACVLTLLYMTQYHSQVSYTAIQYKNSGDVDIGNKDQVVGYYAIAVSLNANKKKAEFNLRERDKKDLLDIARQTIEQYVKSHTVPQLDLSKFSATLKDNHGAFVTLKKHHELRGCIGRMEADEPLYAVVQQMAIAAATQDYRFPPVKPEELNQLEIEISVLTPMRRIDSIEEIEMGRHGIYIRKGMNAGTLLPQVANETGWSKEEFLGYCAQEKAGLGWNGWKDAEIYVYETVVFSEKTTAKK